MGATDRTLRRVLLALDAAGPSTSAIAFAVDLAARFEAEIDTMLLTPAELDRAAALPFASEISLLVGFERRLDSAVMQRSLKSLADRVRATMTQVTGPAQVRWSLALGAWPDWEQRLLAPAAGSLFVLSHPPASTGARLAPRSDQSGVCVVHHEASSGRAALEIATALDPEATRVPVAALPVDADTEDDPGTLRLLACLERFRPATVVLPSDWYLGRTHRLRRPLARLDCNLLLVA